jgi:hypothetical protein
MHVCHILQYLLRFSTGLVSTLAGSGSAGSADGLGSLASFNNPNGLAVDSMSTVYVADAYNSRIRLVTGVGEYMYALSVYLILLIALGSYYSAM